MYVNVVANASNALDIVGDRSRDDLLRFGIDPASKDANAVLHLHVDAPDAEMPVQSGGGFHALLDPFVGELAPDVLDVFDLVFGADGELIVVHALDALRLAGNLPDAIPAVGRTHHPGKREGEEDKRGARGKRG